MACTSMFTPKQSTPNGPKVGVSVERKSSLTGRREFWCGKRLIVGRRKKWHENTRYFAVDIQVFKIIMPLGFVIATHLDRDLDD